MVFKRISEASTVTISVGKCPRNIFGISNICKKKKKIFREVRSLLVSHTLAQFFVRR